MGMARLLLLMRNMATMPREN